MLPQEKYLWCLHCEIVHLKEKWVKNGCECPNCGAGFLDAWRWSRLVYENYYPEKPVIGKVYPLYPPKKG
jgi:hypothetical protein